MDVRVKLSETWIQEAKDGAVHLPCPCGKAALFDQPRDHVKFGAGYGGQPPCGPSMR